MSKNQKRKNNKKDKEQTTDTTYEEMNDQNQNQLVGMLDDFLKSKEGEHKQQEKEDEEVKKLKKKLADKLIECESLKTQDKYTELYDILIKSLKQTKELELSNYHIKNKTSDYDDLSKKNKLLSDKLRDALEDKTKMLVSEAGKRDEITKKCQDFLTEIQEKYAKDLPEKDELIKENKMLKEKFNEYVENTSALKDTLEKQMKLKEQQATSFEDEFRGQIKTKMDEMSLEGHKLSVENVELKNQLGLYTIKFNEVSQTINQYNDMFEKLKNELEKRTKDVITLKKENNELLIKEKKTDGAMIELYSSNEIYKKDNEKVNKQLNMLTNLSKTLQTQLNTAKEKIKTLENPIIDSNIITTNTESSK